MPAWRANGFLDKFRARARPSEQVPFRMQVELLDQAIHRVGMAFQPPVRVDVPDLQAP